jgi:uncharacterized protein (TIGR02001 family)
MIQMASVIVAGVLAAPVVAAAQSSWGGSVTLASNHLLRGVSRSSNDPSLSAELHAQVPSGWFAAAWAGTSRVNSRDDTAVEVAATLGFGGALGSRWSWRGSYTHYESPWHASPDWYRYNEFTLDLQLRDALLLSASWSPDTMAYSPYVAPFLRRGDALTGEISYQHALPAGFNAQAGLGYHDLSAQFGTGYWYGSAGIARSWGRWNAGLSYIHPGTAARRVSWPGTARRRALLTLTGRFEGG